MHSRHCGENSVTTRSPGATLVTPSPTRSTNPAPSWPSTVGAYPDRSTPEAVYISVWQTPQAASRTSTSPALGSARSSSVTFSGWPNCSSTAARIFTVFLLSADGRGRGAGARCPSSLRSVVALGVERVEHQLQHPRPVLGLHSLGRARGGEQQPQIERGGIGAQASLGTRRGQHALLGGG